MFNSDYLNEEVIKMYEAWSDASVRNKVGYISYVILKDGNRIVEFSARVNLSCNYALERLALCLLISKVNELKIEQNQIMIFTDCKAIPHQLNKKTTNVYKQFNTLLKEKTIRKYRKCVSFKKRKGNKAHELSRKDARNWFDYNLAANFA